MSKFGIGHGRLLIVLGGVLGRISPGVRVIPWAETFCTITFHAVAIWTIISLMTGFGYAAVRKLLRVWTLEVRA